MAVIGAGPAGLTAAYELVRRGVPVRVVEQGAGVGGLAQTVEYKGFRFDIGGHRFFTKAGYVRDLWRAMLGPDLVTRPRLSRIYYRGRYFDYPLKPLNAARNLGFLESVLVAASYLRARLAPIQPEVSFADWVSNRFGRRLYRLFFKTYTEKVWGIPGERIGAQWAAQRIKGLSLATAVINMFFPGRHRRGGATITTLIDEFEYPRHGPGAMWEAFRARVERGGGDVRLNTRAIRVRHDGVRVHALDLQGPDGPHALPVTHVISTMPLRELIAGLDPPAPAEVRRAADALKYRDFLTVALIVDQREVFADNWIYLHDESVRAGRIQNYKNWSPDMVPDSSQTCLGLEYFCFEDDGLWRMSDADLIDVARQDVAVARLVDPGLVIDGTVVRMPKAYPVYDEGCAAALPVVRGYLDRFANLQVVGRNGMHKYNNQDHSMMTAILAVQNLFGAGHDLWAVNTEPEYHESQGDAE